MPARAVWWEGGRDAASVANYLEENRGSGRLIFEPTGKPSYPPEVLHQAAFMVLRNQLAEAHNDTDRIVAQEVRALDDLVRTANLLVERLREWYALHAPEVVRSMHDPKELAATIAMHGSRDAVAAALENHRLAQETIGTDLEDADLAVLQGFAQALDGVYKAWNQIEERLAGLMDNVAPHLAGVLGPTIAARMIAQAGSLERLAGFTTGAFQVLGAETALFRHIKDGSSPPKHGILFQHPEVHPALAHQRGSIAKSLASVGSMAARLDLAGADDQLPMLQERLQKKLDHAKAKPRPEGRGPPGRRPMHSKFDDRRPHRRDDRRGPPRRDGPPRDPRRDDDRRGPPRRDDSRGPPRRDGPPRGPRRDDDRRGPPRRDDGRGPSRGGPRRDDDRRGPPRRDENRGAPRREGSGPTRAPRKSGLDKLNDRFRDNKPAGRPGRGA